MSDFVDGKQPVRNDGIYDGSLNDEPSSAAIVASERNIAIGVETLNKRPTAKSGDEDKIALDVALSDGNGNSINKDNALPVYITESTGQEIENYNVASAVAKDGGTANHDYITGSEFRNLNVDCSSSALAKFELQVETAVGAATYSTIMSKFNSISNPNVTFALKSPNAIAAGVTIRVIKTNLDNQATDLYSVINGVEV